LDRQRAVLVRHERAAHILVLLRRLADLHGGDLVRVAEADGDRGAFLQVLENVLGGAFLLAVAVKGGDLRVVGGLEVPALGLVALLALDLDGQGAVLERREGAVDVLGLVALLVTRRGKAGDQGQTREPANDQTQHGKHLGWGTETNPARTAPSRWDGFGFSR